MLWSKLFIPTLREDPAEAASAAHRLLTRAGYVRGRNRLFLAERTLQKIAAVLRDEMNRIGVHEMHLGAGKAAGDGFAGIARELRSYKQFPQTWYQIGGSDRASPVLCLEGCSFDLTAEARNASGRKIREAWARFLKQCGLDAIATAEGFAVASESGEDALAVCANCGYAAIQARGNAVAQSPGAADPEGDLACEAFATPGRKTIAEVAEFTGLPATSQMKSLVMVVDGVGVLALVRGDHQLSEEKLAGVLGAQELRAAEAKEIREWFGASAGSLGPVGLKNLRILADEALQGRRNMIAGANRDDYHLRNVTPGRDFTATFHDLRVVEAGDGCAHCATALELRKGTELARIETRTQRHAEALGLRATDAATADVVPEMSFFRVGIEPILALLVEQSRDSDGMILPSSIAPFSVVVTPVNFADGPQREIAEGIYRSCLEKGIDTLLDDRDDRPGVKFKDADLTGIPLRVVVGKKAAQGVVELVERRTREKVDVPAGEVVDRLTAALQGAH